MTSKPPSEIQTLIENHINGFNTQNTELFLGVFGDTAIIIDGIAPYRWLNPNAAANWLADVEKWRERLGVSHEHLSYEMGFWNVEGSYAYAVVAGTLTVTMKGQNRRSDRHPRIYIFKAWRGVEDRCAGVGAHVVEHTTVWSTKRLNLSNLPGKLSDKGHIRLSFPYAVYV